MFNFILQVLVRVVSTPRTFIRHDQEFVVHGDTVSIQLVVENTFPNPIRIRYIKISSPEHFHYTGHAVQGAMHSPHLQVLSVREPIDKTQAMFILAPGNTLVVDLEFVPEDLHALVSWRLEGARAWPRLPVSLRRSRASLIEMVGKQYQPS